MKSESMSSTPQVGCVDPLDLIDYAEYDTVSYRRSPSLSGSPKSQLLQTSVRSSASTPTSLPSNQPPLSGPSHQYDLYRQQTGLPQGAIAHTLAVNENNGHINGYNFQQDSSSYASLSPSDEFVDFGSAPTRTPYSNPSDEMDHDPAFFYPEQRFVDPSNIGSQPVSVGNVLPTQSSNVGRLWPGMHQQQAALAKAQAQQRQQQAIIAQQRQNTMAANGQQQRQQPQEQRSRAHTGTDPIVEEKISQLLNSMRKSGAARTDGDDGNSQNTITHVHRMRKEEEDMDEDERLLASEEGKKLSSKERRQLRNKVSARAFRSRRKEYISQLEGEIAVKVNENMDLKSQNRLLMEENTRLSDLTRMLLSSPSFSGFLDTLSSNPAAQQAPPAHQQAPMQQEQQRQVRKDVNPYAAQQMQQQQHIGMVMIPEQRMDFAMLNDNANGFGYQPQVYSVLSIPETVIDSSILSGKSSNLVVPLEFDEKVVLPIIERKPIHELASSPLVEEIVDEEFDADPAFALFTEDYTTPSSAPLTTVEFEFDFSTLGLNKPSRFELVVRDIESEKAISNNAFHRATRLCDNLDPMMERLEAMFL